MTRVVVLWGRSRHLSREESAQWAWQQFAPYRASERVRRVDLTCVGPPTNRFGAWFEWMVELEVDSVADANALVDERLGEVLAELRSLKLRPVVLVAEGVYGVAGEG